jgi:hypothetical protein
MSEPVCEKLLQWMMRSTRRAAPEGVIDDAVLTGMPKGIP